ncbi:MAG TPA: signal recognition particle protein Srp19, partial [Candidatus Dadabacteria bacterium]|nr:signal recognition particle protein Srp19 [Candidatus Dadabacteria bacterium]
PTARAMLHPILISGYGESIRKRRPSIIDTSGRHKEEKALLDEIKQLSNEIKPDHTFLVIDSTIGQQSESQARAFTEVAPVGGIILTKLDGAAKGGGAIIAVANTKSSIFFIGTGERIDDLEEFVATRFVGRLIGMGDIQTLLQRVKEIQGEGQDIKMQRIMSGKMTINDLYEQLEQINKMGSLKKIMELIPGMSDQVKEKDIENIEENMEKWKFIIQSMTNEEKHDPDLMNSSRIKRISKGSGRSEKEIKELLNRYKQSKQMMKAGKGRGMRQLMKRFGSN